MALIKTFGEISKTDTGIAGGKGASLGEMTNAGISVPSGFVILSTTFEKFIKETDLNVEIEAILDSINLKEIHTVENASEKIKSLILQAEMPQDIADGIQKFFKKLGSKFVAVRSSATAEDSSSAAWAGQLESYLNTTQKDLLDNVKKCWASLFTPRAIFYRFEKKLSKQKISVAVVIQKMIKSEKSGIAFSVHPVTQDENQIIIEAGWGLGEAIVSGSVTPDSYVLDKKGFKISDINVNNQERALYMNSNGGNIWKELGDKGEKQVLREKKIVKLAKIISKIEKHYGFPCDIEWAYENNKFFIVQSRPITTLTKKMEKDGIFPENYTYLWSNFGLDYFFISYWLHSEYKKNDLVIIYNNKNKETKYFLSKRDIYRMSKKGVNFYLKKFPKWYKEIEGKLQQGRIIIKNNKKINLSLLSDSELAKDFLKKIEFYQSLGKLYFFTEFFFLGNVEKIVNNSLKKHKKIAKNISIMGKVKLESREIITIFWAADGFFANYIDEIKKRTGRNDLRWLNPLQIIEILTGNKKIKKSNLNEKVWVISKYNNWNIIAGKEAKLILNNFTGYHQEKSNKNELKGQIANKGLCKGHAKILNVVFGKEIIKEIAKVNKGDIIIASTTGPDLMPAMKKAGAIVTEQGGITSHAAIISRELGIPCLISVKNATKTIKNGNIIEVNANQGFVKLISSK